MPLRRHPAPALAAVLALATGCAHVSAIAPGTPVQDVQARAGKPEAIWKNPDGSETWEYPLGPVGVKTYMITLGPDRTVREVRQVLSAEYLDRAQPGMSRDEVRRLLGKPGEILFFPQRDEEVWTWRIEEFHFRHRRFHALFDRTAGILRSTLTLDEDRPDGDMRGR